MAYFRQHSDPEAEHQQYFQNAPDDDQEWKLSREEEEFIDFDSPNGIAGHYPKAEQPTGHQAARIVSHTADFVLSVAGILICFLLITVLVYLINWVSVDLSQSFTMLGAGL